MPDLTRFDFHVNRFMNSYSVDMMDASEVGQYLLLLCKSWQMDKECCLPDDPAYLARHARVQEVSPRVLEKFPVVETIDGPARRNGPLYEEWQKACERSNAALARVAGRGGKWAEAAQKTGMPVLLTSNTSRNTVEDTTESVAVLPIPTHTIPTHSIPFQPTNTPGGVGVGGSSIQSVTTLGCWKNMALRHKRVFGTQASGTHKDKYAEACSNYGEEVVLACFDDWSQDAKDWVKSVGMKQPLFAFWKKLPDMAEVQKEIVQEVQQEEATLAAEESARQSNAAATDVLVRQQQDAHAKFMEFRAPRPNEVDPSEYIKD